MAASALAVRLWRRLGRGCAPAAPGVRWAIATRFVLEWIRRHKSLKRNDRCGRWHGGRYGKIRLGGAREDLRPELDCIRSAHEGATRGNKTANITPNLGKAMRGCLHGRTMHVH
eukprot:1959210-Lingulodinium_polyedra.AAC.1